MTDSPEPSTAFVTAYSGAIGRPPETVREEFTRRAASESVDADSLVLGPGRPKRTLADVVVERVRSTMLAELTPIQRDTYNTLLMAALNADRTRDAIAASRAVKKALPPRQLWAGKNGDVPDPLAFVQAIEDRWAFLSITDDPDDSMYVFDSETGVFRPGGADLINGFIEAEFRTKSDVSDAHFRSETYKRIQIDSRRERRDVNPENMYAAIGAVLDLREPGVVRVLEPTPKVPFTRALGARFDPEARCPTFEAGVNRALPELADRDTLQEVLGYVFMSGQPLKRFTVAVGPHDTAKSSLLKVPALVVGLSNVTAYPIQSFNPQNRFVAHQVWGKMLNLYADLPPIPLTDLGVLKAYTGGDPLLAEIKYGGSFTFCPDAKLLFSGNALPDAPEDDEAFYERCLLLAFDVVLPRELRDRGWAERVFAEEGPGVLNWMLAGWARLSTAREFTKSSGAEDAKRAWARSGSSLAWFLEECVERARGDRTAVPPVPPGVVARAVFTERYREFCAEHEADMLSETETGRRLRRLVPWVRVAFRRDATGKLVRSLEGLRWRDEPPSPSGPIQATFAEGADGSAALDTGDTGQGRTLPPPYNAYARESVTESRVTRVSEGASPPNGHGFSLGQSEERELGPSPPPPRDGAFWLGVVGKELDAAVEVLRSWAIAREEFTADQAKAYLTDYGFADGPASGAIGALSGSGHLPCDPGRGTFHYREVAP